MTRCLAVVCVTVLSIVLHVIPVDRVNKLLPHQLGVKNVLLVCHVSFIIVTIIFFIIIMIITVIISH